MSAPYRQAAEIYAAAGWRPIPVIDRTENWEIIPLGKTRPPTGATGREGTVTDQKIAGWLAGPHAEYNIGLRHEGTAAFDVDDGYGDKQGAGQLREFQERHELPKLPPTWSSTSRGKDSPSRQYHYRIPAGLTLESKPCGADADVEICQFHHRFSVVWPSVHPGTGAIYVWYRPTVVHEDGPPAWGPIAPRQVPNVRDLPWLPKEWAKALAVRPKTSAAGVPTVEAEKLVSEFVQGPPGAKVLRALAGVCDPSIHVGHDQAQKMLLHAFHLGRDGESGVPRLLDAITDRFYRYASEARGEHEARRELSGLISWTSGVAQQLQILNPLQALPTPDESTRSPR